jgi:hypothetical protein
MLNKEKYLNYGRVNYKVTHPPKLHVLLPGNNNVDESTKLIFHCKVKP